MPYLYVCRWMLQWCHIYMSVDGCCSDAISVCVSRDASVMPYLYMCRWMLQWCHICMCVEGCSSDAISVCVSKDAPVMPISVCVSRKLQWCHICMCLGMFQWCQMYALRGMLHWCQPCVHGEVQCSDLISVCMYDWSWNIFYGHCLPSAESRRAVVSFWRKNVHNTG